MRVVDSEMAEVGATAPVAVAAGGARVPAWRQRRRGRILTTATTLFAARPYPLVSMDDVAEAARMGKATLYRYFASKEDLYVAVFEQVLNDLDARLDAAVAEGGSAPAVLKRIISILAPSLGEHFRGLHTIDDGVVRVAERKRRLFRIRRKTIVERVEEAIQAGIAAGDFRPVQASACAQMMIGMIWSSSVGLAESQEHVAQVVSDLFLNGALAVRGQS